MEKNPNLNFIAPCLRQALISIGIRLPYLDLPINSLIIVFVFICLLSRLLGMLV